MKKPVFLLCQVLATLFCLFSISLTSLSAFASTRSEATSSSVLRTATHTVSVQEATTAAHYWTAERMKAAKSVDVLTHNQFKQPAASLTLRPVGKPGSTTAAPPAGLHRQGAPLMAGTAHLEQPQGYPFPYTRNEVTADYTQWPYRTEGRIFFTDSLQNQDTCSGTVLNSANKSVVNTAGHCVFWGAWATNWVFCPAYKDGNCPFGRWTARQLFSVTTWTQQNAIEYDYGEAVVNPNSNGTMIVDVVGGQGAAWNWPRNQFFTAFGYPTLSVFSAAAGNRLFVCTSQYATDLDFGSGLPPLMGIGCDMTVYWGGSDGGSWYMDWDATNGGHVNGHNDFKPSDQPEAMYSPYYGDDWHNLVFDPAQNA